MCDFVNTAVVTVLLPVAYAENFHGGGWFKVIWWLFFWCALFVTSQFDVISMFPNQHFGEVC